MGSFLLGRYSWDSEVPKQVQGQALSLLSYALIFPQTKQLIRKYILKQETINLVVVPCNVDIATTEALSMAQEVDPDGDRTIGKKKEEPRRHRWSSLCSSLSQ